MGPDKDGGVVPYVQSERQAQGIYLKYAKQLIDQGDAYYCFCDKERLESLRTSVAGKRSPSMTSTVCICQRRRSRRIWRRENRT